MVKNPGILILLSLCLGLSKHKSQNISGVVNSYARVTGISGSTIVVNSATAFTSGDKILVVQMKGATVNTVNSSSFGNISSMGAAGNYNFAQVSSVSSNSIVVSAALSNTYSVPSGSVQVVKVAKYCLATVTGSVTCPPWNNLTGMGGIIAIEAGTITLNSDITADAAGFAGGNFASSSFCCGNGNFAGAFNTTGGQKGESISAWLPNLDGLKGKQANGGGGGNCGNSGGGGGANAGTGGIGGNQYSGCTPFDDRGLGGLALPVSLTKLFFGGGGGGGFRDNNQVSTAGGNGGGIIYIIANRINSSNRLISARGGNVAVIANDEASGGGGGGGTVFLECNSYSGNLTVNTSGGFGGSNLNSIFTANCHGPGGGGGGGYFAFSPLSLPGNITYISVGGAAGTVNNTSSSCYNTTYGALAGLSGTSQASLPSAIINYSLPVVSISQSNTICAGQSTTLSASGANTYSWSTSSTATNIVVAPLSTSVYTVTGHSGTCFDIKTHTVIVAPTVTLSISGTTAICSGQVVALNATGATNYTWSTGALTSSITQFPQTSTVYTLTGSNSSGCATQATHTVSVTTTPTVSISGNTLICVGQTATLVAGTASGYTWSNGANSASLILSPTTTAIFTVNGANGNCSVSAVKTISVNPNPTISISGNGSICSGKSATITATGATGYNWSTGSSAAFIVVSPQSTTVYSVVGTLAQCSATNNFVVNVTPTPTLAIISSPSLCAGNTITLSAQSAGSYSWNTGGTSSTLAVSPLVNTTYSVIGSNGNCTATAFKTISVFITPTVSIVASSPSICAGGTVQLTAFGANQYLWNTFSSSQTQVVSPPHTTVFLVFGSSNNCSSQAQVTISVIPIPTLSSGTYSTCFGISTATLVASGATNYYWSPSLGLSSSSGATVIASPSISTNYSLQGFNSTCTSSLLVPVQVYTVPFISVQTSTNFLCSGHSATINVSGASYYSWQPSVGIVGNFGNQIVVTPYSTTNYSVFGSIGNGCERMATTSISVAASPYVWLKTFDSNVCKGSGVDLIAEGAENFTWTPPIYLSATTGSQVYALPLSNQVYTITGINGKSPNTCMTNTTFTLNVLPVATISVVGPDSVCKGDKVMINAFGAESYTWSPVLFLSNPYLNNPLVSPSSQIVYTVEGSRSGYCNGQKTYTIGLVPLPFVFAGNDTVASFDEGIYLQATGNGIRYRWKNYNQVGMSCFDCQGVFTRPQLKTCYVVEAVNSWGCRASDEVCVDVTKDYGVYIPNSFSPNGDGNNEQFLPMGYGIIECELMIFNRWGQLLYSEKGNFVEGRWPRWDGHYMGEACKEDSYIYKFTFTTASRKFLSREGEVLLIRGRRE